MIDMSKRPGRRVEGRDYSMALEDMIPSLISENPLTLPEICKAAGRCHSTVTRVMRRLRGKMHIAKWKRGKQGPISPAFKWGEGEDVKKPLPFSSSQKCKRWRRSENGKQHIELANKARYARKKFSAGGVTAIDPLLAAIMGVR